MTRRTRSNLKSREKEQKPICRCSAFVLLPLLISGGFIHLFEIGIPIASSPHELSMVESGSHTSVQRLAGTAALSPNPMPSLGQLGAYYFEVLNQSQVWINLEPQGLKHGPNPIRLNVTVTFAGVTLNHTPDVVEVRAESIGGTFPMTVREPKLRFQLGGGAEMDLTATGKTFQFISRCPDCAVDTVVARMAFDSLRQIAGSRSVSIDALGFTARLKPADLQSLRKFVDVVGNGIRIR